MTHDSSAPHVEGLPGLVVNAHAKINLYLRVLAREESGFHSIETIFQRIALHDEVRVALSSERTLDCSGPAMPAGGLGAVESNLAWKAAALYMEAAGRDDGWVIDIRKNIPVGGGLGGGSADAAAVLRALDTLGSEPLGDAALLELAAQLGSDVPFLLTGWSRALAWGRGTRMMQLSALPVVPVTLVAFNEGVNTGAAYRALADARSRGRAPITSLALDDATLGTWAGMALIAINDFEQVVPAMHSGVRDALDLLRSAAPVGSIAMMSGSGATCFALHPDREFGLPANLGVDGATLVRTETV